MIMNMPLITLTTLLAALTIAIKLATIILTLLESLKTLITII